MAEAVTIAAGRSWRPLVVIAAGLGVLIAVTLALWAWYGTAVFYEMLLAGIALCL